MAVDGGTARLDIGSKDGLRPDDRGEVFYELVVDGRRQRIDLGAARVIRLEESAATIELPAGKTVGPGARMEFLLGRDRRPTEDRESAASPAAGPPPTATEGTPPAGMGRIVGGDYEVGSPVEDALFYNERPSFIVRLPEAWIDLAPAGRPGWSWEQASAHCRRQGKRLPTEFEWEVATRLPGFQAAAGFEWTSSWYLPYPGNDLPEEEYGERFRTVRGSAPGSPLRPRERRFADPARAAPSLDFRCALDAG